MYPPNYDWTHGYHINLKADVNVSNTTSSTKSCRCGFNINGLNFYNINANSSKNIPVTHNSPGGEDQIYPWIWRKEFLITVS